MKKMYKSIVLVLFILGFSLTVKAQVGFGTNNPNKSAVVDLTATNKGFLLPRIALTSTAAAAPLLAHVAGMQVYNTATAGDVTPGYYNNDGTKWIRMGYAGTGLLTADNGITATAGNVQLGGALIQPTTISAVTATNKLAVTATGVDAINLDSNTLSVDATNDRIGIGTATPEYNLQVAGSSPLPQINILSTSVPGSGATFGSIGFSGFDGNSNWKTAGMNITASEAWTPSAHGATLQFATTYNGTSSRTVKMEITNEGYVGINRRSSGTPIGNFLEVIATDPITGRANALKT